MLSTAPPKQRLCRLSPAGFSTPLPLIAILTVCCVLPGCSAHKKRQMKYRSSKQNFTTALESEDANARRDAVVRIAESGYFASDDGFIVLDTVARTDPAQPIRCVAIRALGRYDDHRPIATLLAVLDTDDAKPDALPADDNVQWETVTALTQLAGKDLLTDPQRELVRDVLIKMLEAETSRNVQIEAAKGLHFFPDRSVLLPLIRLLRGNDFALADRAERSLIALTGTTHHYDADAWETWLAATQDPFQNAGQTPDIPESAGPSWWDKKKRDFRRAIRLNND